MSICRIGAKLAADAELPGTGVNKSLMYVSGWQSLAQV
jgi:hypothetical protein